MIQLFKHKILLKQHKKLSFFLVDDARNAVLFPFLKERVIAAQKSKKFVCLSKSIRKHGVKELKSDVSFLKIF
jgi:hypothetical protein